MHDLHQLLYKHNPAERIIDVRQPNEYKQGHVPGSLNIPMGNEREFIDEIRGYDRVFLHCNSRRRAQTVYTMLSMQGLENLVCINSSAMADWQKAAFLVE